MKKRRAYLGLTLGEVSDCLGVSYDTINKFENNTKQLGHVTFLKLCCFYGIDFDDLFTLDKKEDAKDDIGLYYSTLGVLCRIFREAVTFPHTDLFWYQNFMFILEHDYFIRYRTKMLGHKYIKSLSGVISPSILMMIKHYNKSGLIVKIRHKNSYWVKNPPKRERKPRRFVPNDLNNIPKPSKHICDFIEQYTPWIYKLGLKRLRYVIDNSKASLLAFPNYPIEYDMTNMYCSEPFLNILSRD